MCFKSPLQIAVLCCFLLSFAACSSLLKKDGNASSSTSTPSAPLQVASDDPRSDVVKSMKASLDAKSYRTRMAVINSTGNNMNMTAEFVAPNRAHILQDINMSGGKTVKNEIIIIGKDFYTKADDASWKKSDMNMGDFFTQFRNPKIINELTDKAEVKYLGADTLDGVPMLTYEYTIKDLMGKGSIITTKSWVGAADGLPHQTASESDMDLGTGEKIHTKVTSTVYDYNADINIEPPL